MQGQLPFPSPQPPSHYFQIQAVIWGHGKLSGDIFTAHHKFMRLKQRTEKRGVGGNVRMWGGRDMSSEKVQESSWEIWCIFSLNQYYIPLQSCLSHFSYLSIPMPRTEQQHTPLACPLFTWVCLFWDDVKGCICTHSPKKTTILNLENL